MKKILSFFGFKKKSSADVIFETLNEPATWQYMAQFFLGLFFLSAAYEKAIEGFFGPARIPLDYIFQHWINHNLPLEAYRYLMLAGMPWTDSLAVAVIAIQAVIGLLLIFNWRTQFAGVLMLVLQANIYLATYHHLELRVLGSQALWFGIYFFAKPYMKDRLWSAMTYLLVFIGLMHLAARWQFGDPWLSSYGWQRQHFIENVMGISVFVKTAFTWFTAEPFGKYIWAGAWWLKLVLMLGVLTRYRLLFGAVWLVMFSLIEMVWMNAWNCEGVFWVLVLFTWMVHEYTRQKSGDVPKRLLLPS